MADTGLLISHAFNERGIVSEEIYQKILKDKLEMNSGMIIENIVARVKHEFEIATNEEYDLLRKQLFKK